MKELITRVEELAVQASRDARQIETLQGLLKASQSDLMAELTDAIERKKKIDQLASENAALIVSECGHKKAAREAQEKYEESHRLHSLAVEARNNAQEEVRKLRAEVPIESTREALKNTVAKLQEVTTDRDRVLNELGAILAEANKSGRCNGDPVALIKKGQADHDIVQSMERQLEAYSSLSNARAHEIARLNAKVGPLEKCYDKLKAISRENGIITSRFKEVLTVIDETTESLSQLTA
jgi:hypothetical protein